MAQEIEVKTRKLKKVWTKIQSSKQEIEDLQAEFARDREDIADTIRDLTRQLKLVFYFFIFLFFYFFIYVMPNRKCLSYLVLYHRKT